MIIKVGDNSGNTDFHRRLFLKKSYDASDGSPLNLCFLQNIITELEDQLQEITRDEIIDVYRSLINDGLVKPMTIGAGGAGFEMTESGIRLVERFKD